jgi:hypothetical protein
MRLEITTAIELGASDLSDELVTWFEVGICSDHAEESSLALGAATVARVRVAEAVDLGQPLTELLSGHGDMEQLCGTYLEDDGFHESYRHGIGTDLLFISDVVVLPGWENRGIEFALVRHLCDILGADCEMAVMPYATHDQARHWSAFGFVVAPPKRAEGLMHLPLSARRSHFPELDADGSLPLRTSPLALN